MILCVGAFRSGDIPLQKRRAVIAGEAHEQERALPRVEVIEVGRATQQVYRIERARTVPGGQLLIIDRIPTAHGPVIEAPI
jgi:hypothetical protein